MHNQPSTLPIYIVSLLSDEQRRSALKKQFKRHSQIFHYIDAIDGRTIEANLYFQQILPFYDFAKRLMTPSEVGCALSHAKALDTFIESKNPYALILEDDIIGTDEQLQQLSELAPILPQSSVLIAGGQDGIKSSRLLGKHYQKDIYKVANISHSYITRACCYLITREAAKKILDHHNKMLTIADWWGTILNGKKIDLFYQEVLKHPLDLDNSNLEEDRIIVSKSNKKSFRSFIKKESYRLVRNIKIFWLHLSGYRRL